MTNVAIPVDNRRKKYRIGSGPHHDTLRDAIRARFRRDWHSRHDQTIWVLKDVSFEVERGEVLGIISRENVYLSGARRGAPCLLRCAGRMESVRELRTAPAGRAA